MNRKLAEAAKSAVSSGPFELAKGYCSRFVRQVVESVYGDKYDDLFGSSAIQTGKNFSNAGMTVSGSPEIGDILVKMVGSGGFGHIGIYVGDNLVAENSSTSIGRVRGALGYRTLGQWGIYQIKARIQEEQIYNKLFLGDWTNYIAIMPVINDTSFVRARTLSEKLDISIAWDDDAGRVIWDGKVIDSAPTLIDDESYLPLRSLVDANKYSIVVDANKVLLKPV